MDRREAKDILDGYRLLLHEETDLRHAFDIAIEALSDTPTNTPTDTPTNDLIYRQAVTHDMTNEEAIKWIDHRMCFGRGKFTENHLPNIDECWEAGCMAIQALSAERTGEWHLVDHLWECNRCQYRQNKSKPTKFCPNCGAKMNKGGVMEWMTID